MIIDDIKNAILSTINSPQLTIQENKQAAQYLLYSPIFWEDKVFIIKIIVSKDGKVITAVPLPRGESSEYLPQKKLHLGNSC